MRSEEEIFIKLRQLQSVRTKDKTILTVILPKIDILEWILEESESEVTNDK